MSRYAEYMIEKLALALNDVQTDNTYEWAEDCMANLDALITLKYAVGILQDTINEFIGEAIENG